MSGIEDEKSEDSKRVKILHPFYYVTISSPQLPSNSHMKRQLLFIFKHSLQKSFVHPQTLPASSSFSLYTHVSRCPFEEPHLHLCWRQFVSFLAYSKVMSGVYNPPVLILISVSPVLTNHSSFSNTDKNTVPSNRTSSLVGHFLFIAPFAMESFTAGSANPTLSRSYISFFLILKTFASLPHAAGSCCAVAKFSSVRWPPWYWFTRGYPVNLSTPPKGQA